MPYTVTGAATEPLTYSKPSLQSAARLALKMQDQGVENVRVYDPDGEEISFDRWMAAWNEWALTAKTRPPG